MNSNNPTQSQEDYLPSLWQEGVSPIGFIFSAKCVQAINRSELGKDGFMLEVVTLVVVKVRYPFLRIENKMGQVLDMEVGR